MPKYCYLKNPSFPCYEGGVCHYDKPCKNQYSTNADSIRNMSDEELAKWLAQNNRDINDKKCFSWQCREEDILLWLNQPAD